MRHRIDKDCPIAKKAPRNGGVRNGGVAKKPKKHGKGKQMSLLLPTPPNNAGRSGSDQLESAQSESSQSESAQSDSDPKLVTGKLGRGKQMSLLLGRSGSAQSESDQSESAQSESAQSESAQSDSDPKLATSKLRSGKQLSLLLPTKNRRGKQLSRQLTRPAHSASGQSESAQSDSEQSATITSEDRSYHSESPQSDSETSTTNTPEGKSAHLEGTGRPLATPMDLDENVNTIQILPEPQLLAAPQVGNSDPTPGGPLATPMDLDENVNTIEIFPEPEPQLLAAPQVGNSDPTSGGPLATPMDLDENVNVKIQISLEPQLLAAPTPTPVAIPKGVSMQVVANLTNPPAAGPNDRIPVATAEVNALEGENPRRDVHTPVVAEKRKGTQTATAPPPAAGPNDRIPVATAEVNALEGENPRRDVHTPVVAEKRKGTQTATAPRNEALNRRIVPPQEYIWRSGMPVAKQYQTEHPETELTYTNAQKYFNDPNFSDYCSHKRAMVVDPHDQDLFYYEDVDPKEIRHMKYLDGYCWFVKVPNKARVNEIEVYQMFAEVEVPGLYHHAFKKYHAYEKPTRRMVTLYVGDHRFGLRHPHTTSHMEEGIRPAAENLKVHPNLVFGVTDEKKLDSYKATYNETPEQRAPSKNLPTPPRKAPKEVEPRKAAPKKAAPQKAAPQKTKKLAKKVPTAGPSTQRRPQAAENDPHLAVDPTGHGQQGAANYQPLGLAPTAQGQQVAPTPLGEQAAANYQPSGAEPTAPEQEAAANDDHLDDSPPTPGLDLLAAAAQTLNSVNFDTPPSASPTLPSNLTQFEGISTSTPNIGYTGTLDANELLADLFPVTTQQSVVDQTESATQHNRGNVDLVTLPASTYRSAIRHPMTLDYPLKLSDINSLKRMADSGQYQWESIFETQISDPQPNDVYFVDYRWPPGETTVVNVEEKASKDGYAWRKDTGKFFTDDRFILKACFVNIHEESLNLAWSKTWFIFPKEDKMIICYTGSNINAHRT